MKRRFTLVCLGAGLPKGKGIHGFACEQCLQLGFKSTFKSTFDVMIKWMPQLAQRLTFVHPECEALFASRASYYSVQEQRKLQSIFERYLHFHVADHVLGSNQGLHADRTCGVMQARLHSMKGDCILFLAPYWGRAYVSQIFRGPDERSLVCLQQL